MPGYRCRAKPFDRGEVGDVGEPDEGAMPTPNPSPSPRRS